jgi:hypothetical protein
MGKQFPSGQSGFGAFFDIATIIWNPSWQAGRVALLPQRCPQQVRSGSIERKEEPAHHQGMAI